MTKIDDLSGVTRGPKASDQAAANRVAEQLVARKRDSETRAKPVAAVEQSRLDAGQATTNTTGFSHRIDQRV